MTTDNLPGAILIPTPDFSQVALSPQGQLIVPVLSGLPTGNMPGSPLSAGWPYMQPNWVSTRHYHSETWVLIILWKGLAVTRWGTNFEHKILQHPGEIVLVRPGIPHVAENASGTDPVLACEIRTSPDISLDNIPLDDVAKPALDPCGVPAAVLNTLLDRHAPADPPPRGGQMPIQPFQGYPDEEVGRWPH